jgi:hypothetical protein
MDYTVDQCEGLFALGLSLREIERRTGVSRKVVAKHLKDLGYETDTVRKSLPEADVVESYLDGHSASSVAASYGVSPGTVLRVLKKSGVELHSGVSDEDIIAEVNEDHGFGFVARVSKALGVSRARVSKIAKESGYEVRTTKFDVSSKLFASVVDEATAYWLGFMFGDGYVLSNMKDFGVTLAASDRDHLVKFVQFLGVPEEVIGDYVNSTSFGSAAYSKFVLRSHEVCSNLISLGCVPKKSHVVEGPDGLPQELTRHFIRGLVDADGYISKTKYHSVELVGSKPLLDWVVANSPQGAWKNAEEHKSIYRIRSSSSDNAKAIIAWLYSDAAVYLDRKMERAQVTLGE